MDTRRAHPGHGEASAPAALSHFLPNRVSIASIRISEVLRAAPKSPKPQVGNGTRWNVLARFFEIIPSAPDPEALPRRQ